MNLNEFDLRRFREERLKLTAAELAGLLGVRPEQIAQLEISPAGMSLDFLLQLCEVAQMTPNQVLNYKLRKPDPLVLAQPYAGLDARRERLLRFLATCLPANGDDSDPVTESLAGKAGAQAANIEFVLRVHTAKPLLAFLGRSDAGKSSIINALTGSDKLPVQWQPTTSIRVYVKHIADRPAWLTEEAVVFRKPPQGQPGWDCRLFRDEAYCREWIIATGSADLLDKYGTRQGSKAGDPDAGQEAGAALVFIEAPILHCCDIVDLPGFGTGDRPEDDVEAQKGREQADAVVYMSPANSFMNAEDITFLRHILRDLPPLELPGTANPPLANLLVVASQAHIPDEGALPGILQTGAERLYSQVSADVWQARTDLTGQVYGLSELQARFCTYSLDNGPLRTRFEAALKEMLERYLPAVWLSRADQAVREARESAVRAFESELRRVEQAPVDREEALARLEALRRQAPELKQQLAQAKRMVHTELATLAVESRLKFEFWYSAYVTPETIEDIIRTHKYTRRQAQEFLGGNVNDCVYTKVKSLLEQGTATLERQIQNYLDTFSHGVTESAGIAVPGANIPFDTKGALAGGLAAATVLGGFGVWAAGLGGAGTSVLVAKGLSVLGALGISVGGTTAANAMTSAVGDPVALAVSLAVGLGLLMKWTLGESWQARLATKLHQAMCEQDVMGQYCRMIEQYWSDTKAAFDQVAASMEQHWDTELAAHERLLAEGDPERLERLATRARQYRDLFAAVPWEADEPAPMLTAH